MEVAKLGRVAFWKSMNIGIGTYNIGIQQSYE